MTRAQLRSLVKANHGRTDKDDLCNTYLNLGLVELGKYYDFEQARFQVDVTINASDNFIDLPANTLRVFEVRFLNLTLSRPLVIYHKELVVKKFPLAEVPVMIPQRPLIGYIENGRLYFLPPSNATYSLRLTVAKALGTLEADNDEPQITGIDECLVAYVTSRIYRSVQMYDDADRWETQYFRLREQARLSDQRQPAREVIAQEVGDTVPTVIAPWLDPFAGFSQGISGTSSVK